MADKASKTIAERAALLEEKAKKVRFHIIDMIYKAKSGHPGGSLSAADIMTALYFDLARLDPKKPEWPDRDRILLSKGHACPSVYSCLALSGYFPLETLGTLRRFESILQGHPIKKTPGIDMTTGSLGHGLSVGLGMALEGKLRKADYQVYVVLGDGETNEGMVWEAAMAAAKFATGNLIAIVDRNRLQMDGFCDQIMPTGDIAAKFRAFGWETFSMDGHNMVEILSTIEKAQAIKGKPSCIVAETVKGKGVDFMEDECGWHGACPNDDEYQSAVGQIRG
jgi:transketolase